MAVNYVGNISILDRGDAPAQAILDRNARTLAKRVADETKEELGKVMKRVETIYGTYEWSQEVSMKTADVEYINDLIELEELIKDPVKMKKYQKQVTIFIVGYENVCGQKLRLLQQVNEFFMENASKIDDDDAQIKTPEIELDDMMDTIDDTLKRTEDLAQRLGDLNKEMVNYMYDYAQAKASTKSKKKLEKSLNQAKDDILQLNEKLQNLQQELEEREDRIQQMFKQIEVKNMECQRYKTAAEVAKKSAEEADSLREQLADRETKMKEMRHELDRLQIDLGETNVSAMLTDNRLKNAAMESTSKITELQKAMEDQLINMEDAKRDEDDSQKELQKEGNNDDMMELQRLHEKQIEDMSLSHREEVDQLKNQHMEEVKRLLAEVEAAREESQKGESRQTTKTGIEEEVEEAEGEAASTKQSSKGKSLEPVEEGKHREFDDTFELDDEDSWSNIPAADVPGRFLQFRQLTKQKLGDLESTLDNTVKKTTKKVNTLKAQFHEHKRRWESERVVLIEQIEQATKLHTEAEKEADLAMAQLEDFINEQEILEQEEEQKRASLERASREPTLTLDEAEKNLEKTLEHSLTEGGEEEEGLEERLLSQTDDAKVQEQAKQEMSRKNTSLTEDATQESSHPRSALRSAAMSRKASLSVTFAKSGTGLSAANGTATGVDAGVQTLPMEQQMVVESIKSMLVNEPSLDDDQQKALSVVRALILTQDAVVQTENPPPEVEEIKEMKNRTMTIFTLASHISHESMVLGIEPGSLFKTFASLHSKAKTSEGDLDRKSFVLPQTPNVAEELLRRLSSSELSNHKELSHAASVLGLTHFPTLATMGSVSHGQLETPDSLEHDLTSKSKSKTSLSKLGTEGDASTDVKQSTKTSLLHQKSRLSSQGSQRSLSSEISEKLDGSTTEDLRDSVTRSRASLREQHKSALSQLKSTSDERRSKSPKLDSSLLQRSELDDMDLDENGDIPFPPDHPSVTSMHDVGTSPIQFSRNATMKSEKSIPMAEHPIVLEFLKTYESIVKFKDTLGNMFMDKEMMSLAQVLTEIEPVPFEKEDTVQPQIEEMAVSIGGILEEVFQLVSTVVANEREYPVSSLFGGLSRDPTRSLMLTREKMAPAPTVDPLYETKSGSQSRSQSVSSDKVTRDKLEDLQDKYLSLERKYQEDREKHESQLNHNTVVMMEMQDTIHNLQREISSLGHKPSEFIPPQTGQRVQSPPIMFTRLDSDRNAKVMKRAVNEQRLDPDKYKTAIGAMEKYVDIPSKRLVHLANKYAHHQQMRQIEDAVRQSSNLDESVFQVLDKMEALQNERARRWAERMDSMGSERLELANFLMVTLDDIERESGIFLIKPMFSYRSPMKPNVYQGKLSRAYRPPRTVSRDQKSRLLVPTPASQTRPIRSPQVSQSVPAPPMRRQDDPSSGVAGKQSELVGDYPKPTWNPYSASTLHPENDPMWAQVNTPRILELDINRMLIGQNQVSMSIPSSIPSHDRLANAANLSTRTYATLSRPTGTERRSQGKEHRPRSHTGVSDHSAPPTTPLRENTPGSAASSGKKVRISEEPTSSRNLPPTSPLPPIIKESTVVMPQVSSLAS